MSTPRGFGRNVERRLFKSPMSAPCVGSMGLQEEKVEELTLQLKGATCLQNGIPRGFKA